MSIRSLIVDDEPLARSRIRALLRGVPGVTVVGECGDGTQAVADIERLAPELVFLDVQMPGIDGFAVLERIGPERMPSVVFVTAFDKYAVRAFQVHALDYLLKPVDRERFADTLERVRAAREHDCVPADLAARLAALLGDVRAERRPYRILVKDAGRITFVNADEVEWVEAEGNYVRLHVGSRSHLTRETMAIMERELDPTRFVRIHRNAIVRLDRVEHLQPSFNGQFYVTLIGGTRMTLSRGYRKVFEQRLGRRL